MKSVIAVAVAFLAAIPAAAEPRSTSMNVSVRVVARAVLGVDEQPASIVITDADIDRGYVDVTEPIVLRVRTNNPAGYLLRAEKLDPAFTAIDLSMTGASMMVRDEEAWLHRPYSRSAEVLTIRARLYLAPGSRPRVASLPVTFSATPL